MNGLKPTKKYEKNTLAKIWRPTNHVDLYPHSKPSGNHKNVRNQSVMKLRIGNLQESNDSYSHEFGDEVLVSLSAILRDKICLGNYICRFGSDELVVIMPDLSAKNVEDCAKMLIKDFYAISFQHGGKDISAIVPINLSF